MFFHIFLPFYVHSFHLTRQIRISVLPFIIDFLQECFFGSEFRESTPLCESRRKFAHKARGTTARSSVKERRSEPSGTFKRFPGAQEFPERSTQDFTLTSLLNPLTIRWTATFFRRRINRRESSCPPIAWIAFNIRRRDHASIWYLAWHFDISPGIPRCPQRVGKTN